MGGVGRAMLKNAAAGNGFVVWSPNQRRRRRKSQTSAPTKRTPPTESRVPKKSFSYEDILSATNNFSDENLITEGELGKVYKGQLLWNEDVMNFTVRRLDCTYGLGDELQIEISTLKGLKHRNIISILGPYDDENEKIIIYEQAFHGTLDQHLSNPNLKWSQRLQICLGVARALNYIHYDIIHCDINSSKIFLNEDWEPKIYGFELSTKYPQSWRHRLLYSHYFNTNNMTPKYDVYSFGVLLLEILCGRKPMITNHVIVEELDEIIDPNLRKQIDTQSLAPFKNIVYNCLNQQLVQRPTMDQIVKQLEEVMELQLKHSNLERSKDADLGTSSRKLRVSNFFYLLSQLESILESDPLIDEVGFVHPSQFAALSDTSVSMELASSDDSIRSKESQANPTEMAFWSRDHKLGISTNVIHSLYNAAKHAFMSSLNQYKMLTDVHAKKVVLDTDDVSSASYSLRNLETEVMKHSRALLLLSCDFGTAWNCRKEVVSKKQNILLYFDELTLSTLVLSYSPKSERAWSHRRWVIKMIAEKCTNLQEVLKNESELAKKLAEKSKMNYRAWNHRCWLVSYMPKSQIIDELINNRDWSGLHVADNSCFHYRTRLMTRTLDNSWYKLDSKESPSYTTEVYQLWKEELTWSETLIKRYIGREALWLYRRFLSLCWIKHFAAHMGGNRVDLFLDNELLLFRSCTTIPDNVFEDYESQAMFAATYIMWLIKQMDELQSVEIQEKVGEEIEEVLNKVCPNKAFLWDLVRIQSGRH